MSNPLIHVNQLQKTYTAHKKEPGLRNSLKSIIKREKLRIAAVKNVSFDIEKGEVVGFLGPNGAGKTTTLKMLSGILYPSGGEATVLGHTPWHREKIYQKQFSLVMGQKNQLWWDLPAADSFVLNKVIYEIPEKEFRQRLNQLSDLLAVRDILHIQVRKLSLGQRMKCELIAALLHQPRVLFLDEPTIGLDIVSQQTMRTFIRQYNAEFETTILLTSHYMDDVEALCKRVIIIDAGTIIYDGALEKLKRDYTNTKVLRMTFTSPVDRTDFESFGHIQEYLPQRIVLQVPRESHKQIASVMLEKFPVDDILIDDVDIEEVIGNIFKRTH